MKYQHLIYVFAIVTATSLVFSCKKDKIPIGTVAVQLKVTAGVAELNVTNELDPPVQSD